MFLFIAGIVSVLELGLPTPSDSDPRDCSGGGGWAAVRVGACCQCVHRLFSISGTRRERLGINVLVIAAVTLKTTLVMTGKDTVSK